jgi:hypothetical protein
MTTDNFRFYLQNRQVKQVNCTVILPTLVFPGNSNVVELFVFLKLQNHLVIKID